MDLDTQIVLNELLPEIICNLTTKDLLTCRLVNRDWNHVAVKQLRKSSQPSMLDNNRALEQFMDIMQTANSYNFPIAKLNMTISAMTKENVETFAINFGNHIKEYELYLHFLGSTSTCTYYGCLEKVGILLSGSPHIEILRLRDENTEMDITRFDYMKYFPSVLPNLHFLEVKVDQLLRQGLGTKIHFGILYKLIQTMPTIQHFSLNFIGNGFWNPQLTNLLTAMQNVPRISLINLSLRPEDTLLKTGNVQSLAAIKCQMHELSLIIMDSLQPPQLPSLLYNWLEFDGQTLMKLKIRTDVIGICIPCLKSLVSLELELPKRSEISENDSAFLQKFTSEQFPNLSTVHLTNYSDKYHYFSNGVFPKVTKLTLQSYDTSPIFQRWDQTFPNLTTLNMQNAVSIHLDFVFRNFSALRSIFIKFTGSKSTEDSEIAKIIRGSYAARICDNNKIQICFVDLIPPLANLQKLENLELRNIGSETYQALEFLTISRILHRLHSLTLYVSSTEHFQNNFAEYHQNVSISSSTHHFQSSCSMPY